MKLTYEYECAVCHKTETQTWGIRCAEEIPKPSVPFGWRDVLGQLVCQRHTVTAELRIHHEAEEYEHIWRSGLQL